MPFKSEAKKLPKHVKKKASFPTPGLSSRIAALGELLMKKKADLQTLDSKGVSLPALIAIANKDIRNAKQTPGFRMLEATREWRRGRIMDELRNPLSHLKRPKAPKGGMGGGDIGQQLAQAGPGPMAPGGPMPPSNLLGMFGQQQQGVMPQPAGGGMTTMASVIGEPMAVLRSFIERMTKVADDEEGEHGAEEASEDPGTPESREGGEEANSTESASEEASESMSPEQIQQLVNFIVSQGQGIDDEAFHQNAMGQGVDPHEAEEEMYRLLAQLVGGQNDIISGGGAAGKPDSAFPQAQLDKGVEIEQEHTPNPAIAKEIAKDHLVEEADAAPGGGEGGLDYYDDLKKMEATDKRAAAYQYGFFRKIAEVGQLPSEVEERIRAVMEKQAMPFGIGAVILDKILKGIGGIGSTLLGGAKLMAATPLLAAPIVGGLGGWAHYNLTRPASESPEDIKHLERVALLKRLARQARQKAKRLETRRKGVEGEDDETRGGDAHKKILPLRTQTVGIDV